MDTTHDMRIVTERDAHGMMADVHCECGAILGERCEWSGPASETRFVRYMPEYLRGTHVAAGYTDVRQLGAAAGVETARMQWECADRVAAGDDWVEVSE